MLNLYEKEKNIFKINYQYDVENNFDNINFVNIFTNKILNKNLDNELNLVLIEGNSYNINKKFIKSLLNHQTLNKIKEYNLKRLKFYDSKNKKLRKLAKEIEIKENISFNEIYSKNNSNISWINYFTEILKDINKYLKKEDIDLGLKIIKNNYNMIFEENIERKFLILEIHLYDLNEKDRNRNSKTVSHYYDITDINFKNSNDLNKKLNNIIFEPVLHNYEKIIS